MNAFLAEVGTKLADRWLKAALAPGLLWTGVLVLALRLGQASPFDVHRVSGLLDQVAGTSAAHSTGSILIAAGAAAIVGGAVGVTANAIGSVVEKCWGVSEEVPGASWLLGARCRRWKKATRRIRVAMLEAVDSQNDPDAAARTHAAVTRATRRRARLGTTRPTRPTRIGDRFARTAERVRVINGIDDLEFVWPRLWTILPEALRLEIASARDAHRDAARLAGWGALYSTIVFAWWPAGLVGVALVVTAITRSKPAADNLADLIETAVDLYAVDLAAKLGISSEAIGSDPVGKAITAKLRS